MGLVDQKSGASGYPAELVYLGSFAQDTFCESQLGRRLSTLHSTRQITRHYKLQHKALIYFTMDDYGDDGGNEYGDGECVFSAAAPRWI